MSARAGEQMVIANGVDLCTQTFGDAGDPAVLLVHGAGASMLWWEEALCHEIAAGGRHVIRFDNRDTGRSRSYPPGEPDYSHRDLTADAIGILDALGLSRAHLVGRSMAGATVAMAALDHPGRVASLTLISTTPGGSDLSPMSQDFLAATATTPDFDDPHDVIDFLVELMRAYTGGALPFDEAHFRALAQSDVERTRDIASAMTNHFLIDFESPRSGGLSDISTPTLVVHGDHDPVFPLDHGQALHRLVPGSEILILRDVGHELPTRIWPEFVSALLSHTST
jgi:pimeloyl-ACP methyl ester carboxylesterase